MASADICLVSSHNSEEIISLGMIRLLWVVIPEPLNSVMEVLSDSMRGYGYSLPPAIITVVVICTIRIVWVYSVFAAKRPMKF